MRLQRDGVMFFLGLGHDEVDEGAEGDAGGAFGEPGLGVVVPGGAGDVEVDPGGVAGEFADEPGAGDAAAAFAAANVLNVGEAAFDELAVFVVHRHLPHFLADGFGGGEELVCPGLIGAGENADVDASERDDDGTGKRGGVDEMRCAELLGVVDGVGEDEAAFGVGVEDLDRFAGHGGLDIAGLLRGAADNVFCSRYNADYLDGGLEHGERTHGADHGGAAGHVVLHFFHAIGGLDGDTAGVEGYGFADEADDGRARFGAASGRVGDDDHARRLRAALRDAEKRAHLELGDFLFVENFDGEAGFFGHGGGFVGEDFGG